MIALIDADLIAYRCAASAETDPFEVVLSRVDSLIDTIMRETKATEHKLALSGNNNFRKTIYPEYKANRKNQVRPHWLADTNNYLRTQWAAVSQDDCEADDLLGIWQCKGDDTTICSLDKDLHMIPGKHFSWEIRGRSPSGAEWVREATLDHITSLEGYYNFYHQMITGDPSDNIKGIVGKGKVYAKNLLSECQWDTEMFDAVREAYGNDDEMLLNGQCLWIWRKNLDIWNPFNDPSISKSKGAEFTEVGSLQDTVSIPDTGAG